MHTPQDMYHVEFLNKSASAPPDADALTAAANTVGSRAGIGAYTGQLQTAQPLDCFISAAHTVSSPLSTDTS